MMMLSRLSLLSYARLHSDRAAVEAHFGRALAGAPLEELLEPGFPVITADPSRGSGAQEEDPPA